MSRSHPRRSWSSPAPPARVAGAAVVVVAMAMIVAAPWARAQSLGGRSFRLSAFGGYNIASDIYSQADGDASLTLKNAFNWGGRATVFANENSALEFSYTHNEAALGVRTGSGPLAEGFDAGRLNSDQLDFNLFFSEPMANPRLWPFFTFGIGWTLTHPDVQAEDPETHQPIEARSNALFAFNLGAGALVDLNPKLALRFDARWRVTDTRITTSSGVYCDYWGYCWEYKSEWYNSGELTAGLTYRMGR